MQFDLIDGKDREKKKKTRKNIEQTCDDHTEAFGTPTSLPKQLLAPLQQKWVGIYIYIHIYEMTMGVEKLGKGGGGGMKRVNRYI